MEKMIGKPVTVDELQKVLDRQAARDRFVKQIEEELGAIKPGECLLYESKPGAPLWASIGLSLLVEKVKGLKVIGEDNQTYIYREK